MLFRSQFAAPDSGTTEGAPEIVSRRLHAYALREREEAGARNDRESPHYRGFLAPFFQHLRKVAATPAAARQPQPGDQELTALADGFETNAR